MSLVRERRRKDKLALAAKVRAGELPPPKSCPHGVVLQEQCSTHGSRQWVRMPCKSRFCAFCGPKGRRAVAARIVYGVQSFCARGGTCMWMVLTFPRSHGNVTKAAANRYVAEFWRRLKKENPTLERFTSWEHQRQRRQNTLHANLLTAQWRAVPEEGALRALWAAVLGVDVSVFHGNGCWADRVQVGRTGAPVPSGRSVEGLGAYLAKLGQFGSADDQSVTEGRRFTFTRGWPKMPVEETPALERTGEIVRTPLTGEQAQRFIGALEAGKLQPRGTAWARIGDEGCECFKHTATGPPVARVISRPLGRAWDAVLSRAATTLQ